jgi:hypothetical protein
MDPSFLRSDPIDERVRGRVLKSFSSITEFIRLNSDLMSGSIVFNDMARRSPSFAGEGINDPVAAIFE